MYFDMMLERRKTIYLLEHFSRKLISINKISGETDRIISLPGWDVSGRSRLLEGKDALYIYSNSCNYFLKYDTKSGETERIEFENLQYDSKSACYSNFIVYEDKFLLLPFKGNEIKIYDFNGHLQDSVIWCENTLLKNEVDKNIRGDSAAVAGNRVFFSLRCKDKNYLCEFDFHKNKTEIVYKSEEAAIKTLYLWGNKLVFRRIFPTKTEIVFWDLREKTVNAVVLDAAAPLAGDLYVSEEQVCTFVYNKIVAGDKCIYDLESHQVYIGNGGIFDRKEDMLVHIKNGVKKIYKLHEVLEEIRRDSSYINGYVSEFSENVVGEERYGITALLEYLGKINSKGQYFEKGEIGSNIWKVIT